MNLHSIIREPLGHLLVAGLVLYIAVSLAERPESKDEVVVTREALLEYIQYRTKTFDDDYADNRLRTMSKTEIEALISQYQREEVLFREAKKLGLEEGDYVIRQRLVGKLEFLIAPISPNLEFDEEALRRYFIANKQDYATPATISFTHIYFSNETSAGETSFDKANSMLAKLISEDVSPERAQEFGDRFLYQTNYVDRPYPVVAAELGSAAADTLFSDTAPIDRWFGPVKSDHGFHLVYSLKKSPARAPIYSDVSNIVADDFAKSKRQDLKVAAENAILESYKVGVSPEFEAWINNRNETGAVVSQSASESP